MDQGEKLKLFIGYSHQDNCSDNPSIEQFKKHIAPLKENNLIEEWYDRKIFPSDDYQNGIDNNLDDAEIICLFISANFLDSDNCKKEKKKALELRKQKGVPVIPIILSPCGWLDDKDISKLLALPTDGKPISSFQDRNEAWHDVYNGLKKLIQKEIKIKQLKITEEFSDFLQDAEMLTKAHSQKERVFLDDVFVHPELDKYDNSREDEGKISSEKLFKNILDYPKIVIAGEDQSGKTTLCKMIFKELRNKNFIPVYVSDERKQFEGKIKNKILKSLRKQYERYAEVENQIDIERIIPIIDDFHFAKNKESHIKDLSIYPRCIVIVDDVFCLNFEDKTLIGSFSTFKIREFKPTLRYGLIKKWVSLADKERDIYNNVDKRTELIDSILGKTIGKGILPAYPFFILSAIVTYDTFAMPLDQQITSQGYCYQAFIYFYLRKEGVKNDEIDTYINLLTELAFQVYREKKYELSPDDFTSFMKLYLEKYNLPIKQEILFKNLSLIVSVDSFNNYSFRYPYLYYFFVAKYLSDHIEDDGVMEEIKRIIDNLHVVENAYIAVFLAHHSRNIRILEEIEQSAVHLFDKYEPATLIKDEVKFFDKQVEIIVKAVLPFANATPEKERMERLKIQDELEQSQKDIEQKEEVDEGDFMEIELRRAIKTVEVMGGIIKNRAGSLEKEKLEEMFVEAMNVHLRILSYFFGFLKNEDEQKAIIDFISERLRKICEENKREPNDEYLRKKARIIFWNFNFVIVYALIYKVVHSLGSDKLTAIVKKVCDEIDTPASFLVKHGILMWYNKNLQTGELAKRINENDFSKMAKSTIELMVVDYVALHTVHYRDRQRIVSKLGILPKKFSGVPKKALKAY
jgi:hypothetical protein